MINGNVKDASAINFMSSTNLTNQTGSHSLNMADSEDSYKKKDPTARALANHFNKEGKLESYDHC